MKRLKNDWENLTKAVDNAGRQLDKDLSNAIGLPDGVKISGVKSEKEDKRKAAENAMKEIADNLVVGVKGLVTIEGDRNSQEDDLVVCFDSPTDEKEEFEKKRAAEDRSDSDSDSDLEDVCFDDTRVVSVEELQVNAIQEWIEQSEDSYPALKEVRELETVDEYDAAIIAIGNEALSMAYVMYKSSDEFTKIGMEDEEVEEIQLIDVSQFASAQNKVDGLKLFVAQWMNDHKNEYPSAYEKIEEIVSDSTICQITDMVDAVITQGAVTELNDSMLSYIGSDAFKGLENGEFV